MTISQKQINEFATSIREEMDIINVRLVRASSRSVWRYWDGRRDGLGLAVSAFCNMVEQGEGHEAFKRALFFEACGLEE